ncbi:hypothetical protein [Mycolicibacterium palauense]|uniref:hypothetical protein n=1 Tax=Mycolicibacterium palauense TaxID=2034511 RepID=UPI000BFED740|nr:hypothetical protein [Mycolicibacterium palauense]
MARLPSFITRIEGKRGPVYEARINHGPVGERVQLRKRCRTVAEAKAWHAETMGDLAAGTHVVASDLSVEQACTAWLEAKCSRVKPTTAAAYHAALAPVIDRYGPVPVQKLTKADVERLLTELRTGAGDRRVWKHTSINPMLARWKSVWADLHAQGILRRDVVALVEPLRKSAGACGRSRCRRTWCRSCSEQKPSSGSCGTGWARSGGGITAGTFSPARSGNRCRRAR